ncbi:MAG: LysR family transcriptional regulator [Actinobacteria bacterium]|nr:LysR family transcriptional regulator [Actinomycetota bacterium]
MRKLSHFVTVAELLNFTRAAERLHMSQQALSASINRLERELGVTLFNRSSHEVTLTEAGEVLLSSGRPLLATSQAVWDRTRQVGRDEIGVVRIGRTPAITGEEAAALLRGLGTGSPVAAAVEQHWPSELPGLLLAGGIDLALGRALVPTAGLEARAIAYQPLRVAVSAESPLASRGSIDLRELADDTLVVWSRSSPYRRFLLKVCHRAGLEPREVVVNPVQGTPPVTAVRATDEFAFVTAEAGRDAIAGVSVLDLDPPVEVPVWAMWVAGSASPLVAALISEAD